MTLPASIDFYGLIKYSQDDEASSLLCPSCCLCALPGLTPFPSRAMWNSLVKEVHVLPGKCMFSAEATPSPHCSLKHTYHQTQIHLLAPVLKAQAS
jgi:hypothetical protein